MMDIWIAVIVMCCIAAVAMAVSSRYPRLDQGQRGILLLTLAIFSTFIFLVYFNGQLYWARIIPSSAAIIYTNVAAIFAGLGAGWAWRLPRTPRWRRAMLAAALGMAALVAILWPILSIGLRPPPKGHDNWDGPVALQSSWATCSPAAAVTLLGAEGIKISESEMIQLCLTDYDGTPTLGLYRGVKLVAVRNDRQVEIIDGGLDSFLREQDWPALIAVRLPYGADDPRYTEEWGWIPGMGHSVVVLGRAPDGEFIVGDPAAGLEHWPESQLKLLWQGSGLRVK